MTTSTAEATVLETYESTAPHYDLFTAGHDYGLWLGNLLNALDKCGLRGRRLLDVGCGTGKSFLPLLDEGWEVVGVDISPAMLALAESKVAGRARLEVHDMRDLPQLGSFDLVWCLDDAINYLLTAADLRAAVAGLARNMRPGGLAVFDINTLSVYRGFFAETHSVESEDRVLRWRGQAKPSFRVGQRTEAVLEVFDVTGAQMAAAVHCQRHHPPPEVLDAIDAAGLTTVEVFGHGFDAHFEQPLDEARHTKAVFIVRNGGGGES